MTLSFYLCCHCSTCDVVSVWWRVLSTLSFTLRQTSSSQMTWRWRSATLVWRLWRRGGVVHISFSSPPAPYCGWWGRWLAANDQCTWNFQFTSYSFLLSSLFFNIISVIIFLNSVVVNLCLAKDAAQWHCSLSVNCNHDYVEIHLVGYKPWCSFV